MTNADNNHPILLTLAFNKIVEKGLAGKLPDDLAGEAIPKQVLAHEAALPARTGKQSGEASARKSAAEIYQDTSDLLVRFRHSALGSYGPDSTALAQFGTLGTSDDQAQNLVRLTHLAEAAKAPFAAGELALVAALQPPALAAQAAQHRGAKLDKADSTLDRQDTSGSLEAVRATSRTMLQRIKNFIKTFDSPKHLDAYGFGVPLPTKRPRLVRGEPTPPAPNP